MGLVADWAPPVRFVTMSHQWTYHDEFGERLLDMPDGNRAPVTPGKLDKAGMALAVKLREIDVSYWTYSQLARLFDVKPGTVRQRFSRREREKHTADGVFSLELYWELPAEEMDTQMGRLVAIDGLLRARRECSKAEVDEYNDYVGYLQRTGKVMFWKDGKWESRRREKGDTGPFVRQ